MVGPLAVLTWWWWGGSLFVSLGNAGGEVVHEDPEEG